MSNYLTDMVRRQKAGQAAGIYSACTASSFALQAVLSRAALSGQPALIEATANQVNQYGGYTGMKPADFMAMTRDLALRMGFPTQQLILGGDHLGPLTWCHLPEQEAMAQADILVRDFVLAGFRKIHLDTSMRLADDASDQPLSDETIARRGARLCQAAEKAWAELRVNDPAAIAPVYIIGSEVPIPGGSQDSEETLHVTSAADCRKTLTAFQGAFERAGVGSAWERVIGLVVQPGVEFGDADVHAYNRSQASSLVDVARQWQQGVFEGHSTDYQTRGQLKEMVEDGIAILKVGPALTFALREALFALELMENELFAGTSCTCSNFAAVLEQSMIDKPNNWQKHYRGSADQIRLARKYSYSDRARYYLPEPEVERSIRQLVDNINQAAVPLNMLSQFMPRQYDAVRAGKINLDAQSLIVDHIGNIIDDYLYAVTP
jgi:D-tagatose-1,6-bisphosphate aldolase subunit GatZ/KbaZ